MRYRGEAERLRRSAESVNDPQTQRQLTDIAHQYELLALTIDRLANPPLA